MLEQIIEWKPGTELPMGDVYFGLVITIDKSDNVDVQWPVMQMAGFVWSKDVWMSAGKVVENVVFWTIIDMPAEAQAMEGTIQKS
jgi:hypothetical protein